MKKTTTTFYIIGAAFGLYNFVLVLIYYATTYKSLVVQGMSVAYLVVYSILGSWWIGLSLTVPFGPLFTIKDEDKTSKQLLGLCLGMLASFFIPTIMVSLFFLIGGLLYAIFN